MNNEKLLQYLKEKQEFHYQQAKKYLQEYAQYYDTGFQLAIDEVRRFIDDNK